MENYEQKYKEALEWMRSVYPTMQGAKKEDAEHFFPELKKSEDEKIRKAILHLVKSQKEQHFGIVTYDSINWLDMIAWLEKQGEQKPSWSEGDELMVQDAIHWINEFQKSNRCKDENDMQNSVTCENWLKSIKERVQPQPKQEWSEEDEKWIDRACSLLNELNDLTHLTLAKIPHNVDEIIEHLKSLKPRWKEVRNDNK